MTIKNSNKKSLERANVASTVGDESSDDEPDDNESAHPPAKRVRTRSAVPSTISSVCLFCQHQYLRRRGKPVQHLTQTETFEAAEKIQHAAHIREDERVSMAVDGVDYGQRKDPHLKRFCNSLVANANRDVAASVAIA